MLPSAVKRGTVRGHPLAKRALCTGLPNKIDQKCLRNAGQGSCLLLNSDVFLKDIVNPNHYFILNMSIEFRISFGGGMGH